MMYRVMVKKNDVDPIFKFPIKNTVKNVTFDTLEEAIEHADLCYQEKLGETVTVAEMQPNGKAPIQRYMRALWAEGEGH